MGTGGDGGAARIWDQPNPCERLPPLCRRPLDTPMAATSSRRAGHRVSVCRLPGDRLSTRNGWERAPRSADTKAGAIRPVGPRGQDPADRVRAVRRRAPSGRRATAPGDLQLSGVHALLREDQKREVHDQAEDASDTPSPKAEGAPRGYAAADAHPGSGAASVAMPSAERSLSVLRGMTKSAAIDLGSRKIRVNSVH